MSVYLPPQALTAPRLTSPAAGVDMVDSDTSNLGNRNRFVAETGNLSAGLPVLGVPPEQEMSEATEY